jgi:hypothetical protein
MEKDRGMKATGNLRCRFEFNIKIDRKEIGWGPWTCHGHD